MGDVAKVLRGASPRPKSDPRYYGGNVPRLMVADVTRDGRYVTPKIDFLTEEGASLSRPMPAGTLTIVCSGDVGTPSFLAVDACIHDGFLAVSEISDGCLPDYIYEVFQHLKSSIERSATHGGVFTNLTTEILRNFTFLLPPIQEQLKIAKILQIWDDADDKLKTLQLAKERRLQSLRYNLLMGAIRANGPGKNWQSRKLAEVTRELTARNGGLVLDREKVMGVSNTKGLVPMREQTVAEDITRYKRLPPRAFAYNPMRINVGSIAMNNLGEEVLVSPDYVVFACEPNGLEPDYLDHLTETRWWMHHINSGGSGSVRQRTYYADLAALQLPLPDIDEQRKIVELLNLARHDLAETKRLKAAIERQKRGLMQKLLTGEWRVEVGGEHAKSQVS
ncbi:restriction endonuclease subunit S [Pararhizobium sp. O133]|uniref:restriction endonuclease subunit S n=1 Tax=Pararhizobium sp. O133 TaxID=3449278 RepID=UPI003F682930